MLGFLSLIPSPVKIGIYAIICGLLIGSFLWYRSSLINKGKQEGRQEATQRIEQEKQKEWQAIADQLDQERQQNQRDSELLAQEKSLNAAEKAEIARDRAALIKAREKIYAETKKNLEAEIAAIRLATGNDIDDVLRGLSARIDDWKATRQAPVR